MSAGVTGRSAGPLLLGVDTGQTVTKAALFDLDGREVAVSAAATSTRSPHARWQERDMEAVWDQAANAVRGALAGAGADPARVLAVGLCGHNDGMHLVDEQLRPVRPAVLATDSRAHAYAARTRTGEVGRRALERTGQVPFAGSPASLLAWLRDHEPDSFARARWTLFCKDWVRLRLTGEVATDPTEASASFTDVHTQAWSAEALSVYGLEPVWEKLPPILPSAAVAGRVTAEAAAATGLCEGTPVVTGAHDVDAAAVGIGASEPGALSVVMGTFSINQVVDAEPRLDARWQARSFVEPARWLHMSTSPSSASNLDWVLRRFGPFGPDGAPDPQAAVREASAGVAADGTAARRTPVFLPFLFGSPHGDAIAASLVGLRGWHDRGDVLRAVLEGVVFNHRTHVDALRDRFDVRSWPARLTGGGARSPQWAQLLADALGLTVEVTDADQASARGAALLAGVGVGVYLGLDDAVARAVRVVRRHDPDCRRGAALDRDYARYQRVVDAMLTLHDDVLPEEPTEENP